MRSNHRFLVLALAACFLASLPIACGGEDGAIDDDGKILRDGGPDDGRPDGSDPHNPDDPNGDAGTVLTPDAACAASSANSNLETVPVDIIIAIDNSCSMSEETQQVNENINAQFAQIMANSGIDYRVVMVSKRGELTTRAPFPTCVKAPLGDASCGATCGASNAACPRFQAVDLEVGSTNALTLLTTQTHYDKFKNFLRPDSQKVFLIITDDNSSISADSFEQRLAALKPALNFKDYVLHAIYGYPSTAECPTLAKVGTVYDTLTTRTGGERAKVCETDWKPLFNRIAEAVVKGTKLACELKVPEPPPGKTVNPAKMNVIYTSSAGAKTVLQRVETAGQCGAAPAFYFDNNTKPTRIFICPQTCPTLQNDQGGKVEVLFACKSNIG